MNTTAAVHTVLGPVDPGDLGVVAVHEALLSVIPGAQYAFDLPMDRAEIHAALARRLDAFKEAGGGTVVDVTGMFHGRDVRLLESLSRATGVHIVASTGMGPEADLGGYFLTPQTNPPTPWPAERFADLFAAELTEGMVVPRVERRGRAGLVVTATTPEGATPTDESLVRGAADAALSVGAAARLRVGADPLGELENALASGIDPARVLVAGFEPGAPAQGRALEVAQRGAAVVLQDPADVVALVEAGLTDRVLLTGGTVGHGVGLPTTEATLADLLTSAVPRLREAGVPDDSIDQILVATPRDLLTVR